MKLQKLALTALALSMSAAFAAGTDKQAEGSSANQAAMAQSASANQPSSSTADQSASSSTDQAASSTANQAASSTDAAQSSMSSEGATAQADPQVRQVQQALKDKGHDPGQIDGVMGPQTKQALQSFQQAQGISGAGELDQQTLAALDVQGDSSASNTSSNQPSSANSSSMSSADQASQGNQAPSSANQDSSSTNQGYTKQ
jgi:peptidoglycan hydrolase-like protein with peptidoglycan-binding domain